MQKLGTILGGLFLFVTLGRGAGTFVYDIWLRPPLAVPPPQPLPLAAPRGAEDQAREAVVAYLARTQGLDRGALDPELLERAYYLAGEASSLYWTPHYVELFPPWAGYRYVVGRADGAWTRYWSGCRRGNQVYGSDGTVWAGWGDADTVDVAVHPYPGLADAERVGVAVAWRQGRAYVAVMWDRDTSCPERPAAKIAPGATIVVSQRRPAAAFDEK
jgi:hypothetical protein